MEVREIVKTIRQQQGWTQEELGKFLGVTKSQVCMIENGNSDMPASKFLKLLRKANWGVVSY